MLIKIGFYRQHYLESPQYMLVFSDMKCNSIANEFGTSTFQCKQCMEVFSNARQLCAHAVAHIPPAPRAPNNQNGGGNNLNTNPVMPGNKSPITQVTQVTSFILLNHSLSFKHSFDEHSLRLTASILFRPPPPPSVLCAPSNNLCIVIIYVFM